jgi:YjbE family integral membrane protein
MGSILQYLHPSLWGDMLHASVNDMGHAAFWAAVLQIVFINMLLSGDNAIVIAMACRDLPQRQRFWGLVIGAGAAVLLRLVFTGIVGQLMLLPYLKLIGGLALVYVAAKLLVPERADENKVEAVAQLWRAVRIVVVADIVMSLDNVIAVAAIAQGSLALLAIGLVASIPIIIAGAALIMVMLDRFPIFIWAGAALLGWIAGDVMVTDSALGGWFSEPVLHQLHIWGGPVGGIIVIGMGYMMVGKHRRLILDEILAGVALLIWIVVDRVNDSLFGGANPELLKIWAVRGALFAVMIVAYSVARSQWHIEQKEV